jgi:hypothetical protein
MKNKLIILCSILLLSLSLNSCTLNQNTKNPGPIQNDMILPPGAIENIQLKINFNDGNAYKALQDVTKEYNNPLSLLETNVQGIKREMNWWDINSIIQIENNKLILIGTYTNNNSKQWRCYINEKLIQNPSEVILQNNDLIEWKYETQTAK